MPPVFIGNSNISQIALGNNDIAEAYLGNNLVYQKTAGPGPINPADWFATGADGLAWDFGNINNLFQDTARTEPVTGAGQDVLGITDLSGNGHHAVPEDTRIGTYDVEGGQTFTRTNGGSRIAGQLEFNVPFKFFSAHRMISTRFQMFCDTPASTFVGYAQPGSSNSSVSNGVGGAQRWYFDGSSVETPVPTRNDFANLTITGADQIVSAENVITQSNRSFGFQTQAFGSNGRLYRGVMIQESFVTPQIQSEIIQWLQEGF